MVRSAVKPSPEDQDMELIASARKSRSKHEPPAVPQVEAPDGGLQAWLVVSGSFVVHVAMLGMFYSSGIFVIPYTKEFNVGRGAASVQVSLAMMSWYLSGSLTGHAGDVYGVKKTTFVGATMFAIFLTIASFATNIWVIYVFQGLALGISFGLTFFPSIASVSQWFSRRRGLATGLAAAGSGVGNFAFPPILERIILNFGWRWALRGLAIVGFTLLMYSTLVLQRRLPPDPSRHQLNWHMLKNRNFLLLSIAVMLLNVGYSVPFVHLVPFAVDHGIPPEKASFMLSIIGGCSAIGRMLIGLLSDSVGRLLTLRVSFLFVSLLLAIWPLCTELWSIALFSAIFGLTAGSFIATFPVVVADMFGVSRLSSNYGLAMTFVAFSGFATPAVGSFYDRTGSYVIGIEVVAALTFVSFVLLMLVDSKAKAVDFSQASSQQLSFDSQTQLELEKVKSDPNIHFEHSSV
eukprot:c13354_g1_i1.p1 GENE.c13354_g1_i1~~c13354_g1_i1.p1  ORF type:complete len:491 (-),score=107.92 c13354_g1_i1:122-1504(-)